MNNSIKRILNIVSTVVVILAVILAILLVGVRVVGLQVFTVLSGSMEPEYHTGSLIYVKKVDTSTLKVGDVITFMLDEETIATHRIVESIPSAEDPGVIRFRTKGDANEAVDGSLIHYKNVVGTPVFTIPLLGYLSAYIQNPPGTYVAISVGAILLILVFLPDLLSDSKEEEEKKQKKRKPAPAKAQNAADASTAQPQTRPELHRPSVPQQPRQPIAPNQTTQYPPQDSLAPRQQPMQDPQMIRQPRHTPLSQAQPTQQQPIPRAGRRPPQQPPQG